MAFKKRKPTKIYRALYESALQGSLYSCVSLLFYAFPFLIKASSRNGKYCTFLVNLHFVCFGNKYHSSVVSRIRFISCRRTGSMKKMLRFRILPFQWQNGKISIKFSWKPHKLSENSRKNHWKSFLAVNCCQPFFIFYCRCAAGG